MASLDDINSTAQGIVRNLGLLVTAMSNLVGVFTLSATGSFTLGAAASTVVADTAVKATSKITWTPANASAATLQGSARALYVSAISAGVGFTVATGSGAAATGGEQFSYTLVNPTT